VALTIDGYYNVKHSNWGPNTTIGSLTLEADFNHLAENYLAIYQQFSVLQFTMF